MIQISNKYVNETSYRPFQNFAEIGGGRANYVDLNSAFNNKDTAYFLFK